MRATANPFPFIAVALVGVVAVIAPLAAQVPAAPAPPARPPAAQGEMYRSPSGATLHLILSDANIGPEVSLGEITFPPNADSGDHAHGAIEILYVLSGQLEHFVNGKSEILTPGMAGFVKPPDKIRHKTGPAGAKVLVVWVPGDEARKITARWAREP